MSDFEAAIGIIRFSILKDGQKLFIDSIDDDGDEALVATFSKNIMGEFTTIVFIACLAILYKFFTHDTITEELHGLLTFLFKKKTRFVLFCK